MRPTEDKHRHQGLRKKLVEQLSSNGISNDLVLAALAQIPRHFFLDSAFDDIAYENRAFPIGEGQTISHPYTVAYQTQLLDVKRFEKVLEVGTGSAYQAVVLAMLGVQVFTIERQRKLYDSNKQFKWLQQQHGIKFFYGDGFEGLPTFAPFDKILITAAAPHIPPKLVAQLKIGGMMVLPVGEGGTQQMCRVTRKENNELSVERFEEFSFVPMLTGKES